MPRVTVTATGADGSTTTGSVDYWYERTVAPRLLVYDSSPQRTALETADRAWSGVLGIDQVLRSAVEADGPVAGGARNYLAAPVWDDTWADAAGRLSNVTLFNSWTDPPYDVTGILAGRYDEGFRAAVRAKPAGQAWYWTVDHEPEFHGVDAQAWAAGIRRFVAVVAAEARSRSVPPAELAVGGLVTSYALTNAQRRAEHAWWEELPAADLPYAAFFLDTYCKHVRTAAGVEGEPLAERLEQLFGYPRAAGIGRFVVGETALARSVKDEPDDVAVGTDATMAAWVRRELPKCRAIPGLEVLAYFHKPTGPQSKLARLEGEALVAFAEQCLAWNRS